MKMVSELWVRGGIVGLSPEQALDQHYYTSILTIVLPAAAVAAAAGPALYYIVCSVVATVLYSTIL